MPGPERLPPGALRDLVQALHKLYRDAGKPGTRVVSNAIRDREDLRDTVSHETISAMLRGGLARWIKVECLVRQLAEWSVDQPDPDDVVREFHRLWLAASDSADITEIAPPRQVRRDFVTPGATGASAGTVASPTPAPAPAPPRAAARTPPAEIMIAGVPGRNAHFIGRLPLLRAIQAALAEVPGKPVVLHGLGGVGKTQLAIEYLHRFAGEYDLAWWLPAEQVSQTRSALAALGERLDLPASVDTHHTAQTVLNALESSALRWLLVYDNADLPAELTPLLAMSGGHTIVTTRNPVWMAFGRLIEVDVFAREESIELLHRRGRDISVEEAARLADQLGDLPLALDQVAAMQATTGMAVAEYLQLFAEHLAELLATSRSTRYPASVATSIVVAFDRLRAESPAAAQLLELFTWLGPEQVSVSLLRSGGGTTVSPPLGRALHQPDSLTQIIGAVGRFGLARASPDGQHIQVHRLVQVILRDAVDEQAMPRIRRDVRQLLASANPSIPDDPRTWALHREIGPHVVPSGLIDAGEPQCRQVVLDQMRYLYRLGDFYEGQRLAAMALAAWSKSNTEGGLEPDHEHVVIATGHLANLLRALGHYEDSRRLTSDTLELLRDSPQYGEDHPQTLAMARSAAVDLRVTGDYRRALEVDERSVGRHRRLYGPQHPSTMAAMSNLAVSLRMTGDFAGAYEMDQALVNWRRRVAGDSDPRTLLWTGNLARDLYGLGRYAEALRTQRGIWVIHVERLGSRHNDVLMAGRTLAIAERKVGNFAEALRLARENYHDCHGFFGPDHEFTLAALMSYANTMRGMGDPVGARSLATEALARYRRVFSPRNPLTLAAAANLGIILRTLGDRQEALRIDQVTVDEMRQVLGEEHRFTLAASVGLANDLASIHERGPALALSGRTLAALRRVCGEAHPETLACGVNAALDQQTAGDGAGGEQLRRCAEALRERLGPLHPMARDATAGKRIESDIEPPPT